MQKRLRPAIKPYAKLFLAPAGVLFVVALASWLFGGDNGLVIAAVAGIGAGGCVLKFFDYAYTHYVCEYTIDDSEITMITGFWAKDERHVPIDKIEDYKVDRSLVSKLLRLADIGVQTGRGERGFEVTLHSIPDEETRELDAFLDRMTRRKPADS